GPRRLLGLEEAPEDRPGGAALGVEPVRDARVAVGDGDPVARAGAELHLAAVQRDAPEAVVVAHHPAVPEHDVREAAARELALDQERLVGAERVGPGAVRIVDGPPGGLVALALAEGARCAELVRHRRDPRGLLLRVARRDAERALAHERRREAEAPR